MKKNIIIAVILIIFIGIYYYIMLPPLNLQSYDFWTFLIFIIAVSQVVYLAANNIILSKNIKFSTNKRTLDAKQLKIARIIAGVIIVPVLLIIIINIINSPLFNANKYANRIVIDEDKDFSKDVAEVNFNETPLLDKDSTIKLGDRVMGEISEWVSQFYVSDLYTQINYQDEIMRVTPIEYDGLIKYFTNKGEGIKGYISVNSVDGKAKLNEIDKGMKYLTSAYFSEDLDRHLRFSYPTKVFGEKSFEIDEEGNPYFVVPTIKYSGINLRAEVDEVIILDVVTGDTKKYSLNDVPEWVDHVQPSNLIIEQVNNWGTYSNGFINSIFGQKGVVNTTAGYNYLNIDGDIYLYTGITSVLADESNLGFILANLRTKEVNYYKVVGAPESSAMRSAEGLVQEKNYNATFPLLINLNDRPTYLLSLKDSAGLVKMYAFVDVADYQIVSTTESSQGISQAVKDYEVKINNKTTPTEKAKDIEKEITIKEITSAVINGTTFYYIVDTNNNKYQLSITVDEYKTPFLKEGSKLTVTYSEGSINIIKEIE